MGTRRFEYVSDWRFDAPLEAVWDALIDVEQWPRWWPHVRDVRTLDRGDASGLGARRRIRWSSRLPYGFTLDVETVEVARMARLRGRATGDMAGTGLWELWCDDAGSHVRYTWELALHTRWMRLAAPLMAPVFRWNHEGVMRSGAAGLKGSLTLPAASPQPARRLAAAGPFKGGSTAHESSLRLTPPWRKDASASASRTRRASPIKGSEAVQMKAVTRRRDKRSGRRWEAWRESSRSSSQDIGLEVSSCDGQSSCLPGPGARIDVCNEGPSSETSMREPRPCLSLQPGRNRRRDLPARCVFREHQRAGCDDPSTPSSLPEVAWLSATVLVQGTDGALYGTTGSGGRRTSGRYTV
jgi:hypothetical protein